MSSKKRTYGHPNSAVTVGKVASSPVFPRNWASFDEVLGEKFSSRGFGFLSYFLPSRSAILG